MSIGVRPVQNLFFAPTIPNSGRHQPATNEKMENGAFSPKPFFTKKKKEKGNCIIEATLRIRVVFPNNGNTLIKATPNKGNAFEPNLSKTVATLLLFGGGFTPFLGTFWRFWGFPVKTVCHTGLPGNPSQRKRYTHRRSSQRSSLGSILYSLRVQGPN